MTTKREPGGQTYIQWNHIDGPVIIFADGRIKWLTVYERMAIGLRLTYADEVITKHEAKRGVK